MSEIPSTQEILDLKDYLRESSWFESLAVNDSFHTYVAETSAWIDREAAALVSAAIEVDAQELKEKLIYLRGLRDSCRMLYDMTDHLKRQAQAIISQHESQ